MQDKFQLALSNYGIPAAMSIRLITIPIMHHNSMSFGSGFC